MRVGLEMVGATEAPASVALYQTVVANVPLPHKDFDAGHNGTG
jgi:hypothetical protein